LFWIYACGNALPATFSHGATLVLQAQFDADEAIDLIDRHRCTSIYTLPAMTRALVRSEKFAPARTRSLRTGLTIGSPSDVETAATTLGARDICNIYGATEIYGNCCVTPCDWPLERRMNCQGPPLPGVTVRIVDPETRAVLPQGEIGEAEVAGYRTPGYAGASAEYTAKAVTADGFFRTGDLGFLDKEGNFHFASRSSEIIKRSGINVSPAEIEEHLQRYGGVHQAGVVGAPDEEKGEIIVAFVVPQPGASLEPDAIRQYCRSLLSSYKVPDRVEICTSLPSTETGKIARRQLKELAVRVTAAPAGRASGG
jgi:fatty-acyl-CoA synthase